MITWHSFYSFIKNYSTIQDANCCRTGQSNTHPIQALVWAIEGEDEGGLFPEALSELVLPDLEINILQETKHKYIRKEYYQTRILLNLKDFHDPAILKHLFKESKNIVCLNE